MYVYLHCCAFNIRCQCYFEKNKCKEGIVDFSRFLNHSDITPLFMGDLKRQRRRPKRGGGWVGCVWMSLQQKSPQEKRLYARAIFCFSLLPLPSLFLSLSLFVLERIILTLQWRSLTVQSLQTTTTTPRTLSTTMHRFHNSI